MRILSIKRVGAIALGILALIILVTRPQPTQTPGWQTGDTAPTSLIEQIISENIYPGKAFDSSHLRIWKIKQSGQHEPLYLINTQVPKIIEDSRLCGSLGCAILGYQPATRHYQQVLNVYLNPHLPLEIPFIELSDSIQNGLPVLLVNQMHGHHLQQITLTFNGHQYEATETTLFPKRYE
jgi:hypothetical protein